MRAGPDRRLLLRLGELARGPRAERAQRLRHRPQRAEVGAGPDDHLRRPARAASRSPPRGGAPTPRPGPGGSRRCRRPRSPRRRGGTTRAAARAAPASIDDSAPTRATVRSRTVRRVAFASRVASRAPRVSLASSAPRPAAIESPTTSRSSVRAVLLLVLAVRRRARPRPAACRSAAGRSRPGGAAAAAAEQGRARDHDGRGGAGDERAAHAPVVTGGGERPANRSRPRGLDDRSAGVDARPEHLDGPQPTRRVDVVRAGVSSAIVAVACARWMQTRVASASRACWSARQMTSPTPSTATSRTSPGRSAHGPRLAH